MLILACRFKQALEVLLGERGQPSIAHPFNESIVENVDV